MKISALRGGAATVFYPIWHLEVESLLVLKNNRGVEDNRARHLDYGVQINKLMYQRFLDNKEITLFSPHQVTDLYEAFFADQDKFEELYLKYEKDETIMKRTVNARDLFTAMMNERASTGRIYIQNVDHSNSHGAFIPSKAPVQQSNLCLEIELPTSPISAKNSDEGEIALCTLAAVNVGNIESTKDIEERMDLLVRMLDEILDYQNYPVKTAEKGGRARRSLGIGVINFAYYLTRNWAGYNHMGIDLTHELFEAIQYYGLKTSVELAKEKGKCEWFEDTKYSQGILPIDTYKKELDEVCNTELKLDWESLRQDILKYGLRNSTITAQMPSESSSTVSNSTNGIEPPRGLVTVKANKEGIVKQVVPDIELYSSLYPLTWRLEDNKGYITLVAVMQKFVDQSISANTNYDPKKFPNGKVPMGQLMKDLLLCYKLGVKTLYYHNTRDGNDDNQDDFDDCEGGACKI